MTDEDRQQGEIDAHVGNRIRMRRTFLRLSQEKLGERLGVTFQQIQKYEKGANRIGAGQLLEIAKLLKVEPNYFFEGLMDRKTADAGFAERQVAIQFDETVEGVALNRAFARIKSKKIRRRIVDLVAALAESETV